MRNNSILRGNGGFTLVELIVVIAILAILAGVAVPAYSGYIAKANEAADLQLLSGLNTAFASACLEQNLSMDDMKHAEFQLTGEEGAKKINGLKLPNGVAVTLSTEITQDVADALWKSFKAYYGDSLNTPFKAFIKLVYIENGFKGFTSSDKQLPFVYNGNTIFVSTEAIGKLTNSTFGTKIGAEALLGEVDNLTQLVGGDDINVDALLEDPAYMKSLATYVGAPITDDMSDEQIAEALSKHMEGKFETEQQYNNFLVNGLVYYAADKSADLKSEDVTTLLTSGNVFNSLAEDTPTKLAQASMAFGMYTSFVNSDYYKGESTDVQSDPMSAIRTISGAGENASAFTEYMKSDAGKADLEAYMAAMSVINDSTGNEATADVLMNGFADPNLVALIQQAMGGQK